MAEVLVVAGETSGEEHALGFIPRLASLRPELRFWGVGGDRLRDLGMENLFHLRDFSSMGFSEVFAKIPFYRSALEKLESEALKRGTRDAVLVDFQDFNLRLAQRLHGQGVRVWYYVAPQAWGWRPWRARTLAKVTHRLFTILPFEEEWFKNRGVRQTVPVPHPLMHAYAGQLSRLPDRRWEERLTRAPRVMLLPGSRRSEVAPLLPLFLKTARELRASLPDMRLTLARVPTVDDKYYACALGEVDGEVLPEALPEALLGTDLAIAASGTVTLGTALLGVPTVVAYQSSLLNEFVVRRLVGYDKAVSLPNLVLGVERVFPELLQQEAQSPLIRLHVLKWLKDPRAWETVRARLASLPSLMRAGEQDVGAMMAREMG